MAIPDEIETGGVTSPLHTHTGSFVPILQKCPVLEILNIGGFFLIIVGQTFKIMHIKNNCR